MKKQEERVSALLTPTLHNSNILQANQLKKKMKVKGEVSLSGFAVRNSLKTFIKKSSTFYYHLL